MDSRPSLRRPILSFALSLLCLGPAGCIKQMLLDGQIEGTRQGAAAMNGTADFDLAKGAAAAGMAQFEGLHYLSPKNEDGIFLLVSGYTSFAFAFVEDDMELAILDGKDEMADYHKQRAVSFYTRAVEFGQQWLESKNDGFLSAAKSGKQDAMVAYLKKFDDEDDAEMLVWIGQAWMARANVSKSSELIGTVYVGRAIMDRVAELNDKVEHGSAHAVLGAYDARTGVDMLGDASFQSSKVHFDKAMQISQGKALLTQLQMAKTYACRMRDPSPGRKASFAMYRQLLNDVLAASDPLPEQRLANAIAKRRARRYLSKKWIEEVAREDCGWDLSLAP